MHRHIGAYQSLSLSKLSFSYGYGGLNIRKMLDLFK